MDTSNDQRDLSVLQAIVERGTGAVPSVSGLTDDEVRDATVELHSAGFITAQHFEPGQTPEVLEISTAARDAVERGGLR